MLRPFNVVFWLLGQQESTMEHDRRGFGLLQGFVAVHKRVLLCQVLF